MKKIIIIFLLVPYFISAQNLNWNRLKNGSNVIHTGFGLDYSMSYSIGYSKKMPFKRPMVSTSLISLASGKQPIDDLKLMTGSQIKIWGNRHFSAIMGVSGIYRRFETPLVRLNNFGSEVKGSLGYYKKFWFVATEASFDKAIVTHFKHSDSFKENINNDVINGWYGPATGGNLKYGIQTGVSFRNIDLILNTGQVVSQDLKTKPLLPFFGTFSVNINW